jgi:hypothetical protein
LIDRLISSSKNTIRDFMDQQQQQQEQLRVTDQEADAVPEKLKKLEHDDDQEHMEHMKLGSGALQQEEKNLKKNHAKKAGKRATVPYYKLYQYADKVDVVLMLVGTLAAVANGLIIPAMLLIQSKVLNSFGTLEGSDPTALYRKISHVCTTQESLDLGCCSMSS